MSTIQLRFAGDQIRQAPATAPFRYGGFWVPTLWLGPTRLAPSFFVGHSLVENCAGETASRCKFLWIDPHLEGHIVGTIADDFAFF